MTFLKDNFSTPLKDILKDIRHVVTISKQLEQQTNKLKLISKDIETVSSDINQDIDKFKFKTNPRIEKINYRISHIQSELNKFTR